MAGSKEFEKEEMLLFLIQLLIERYGQPFEKCIPDCRDEIEQACIFMQQHFEEHITLERLCNMELCCKNTWGSKNKRIYLYGVGHNNSDLCHRAARKNNGYVCDRNGAYISWTIDFRRKNGMVKNIKTGHFKTANWGLSSI